MRNRKRRCPLIAFCILLASLTLGPTTLRMAETEAAFGTSLLPFANVVVRHAVTMGFEAAGWYVAGEDWDTLRPILNPVVKWFPGLLASYMSGREAAAKQALRALKNDPSLLRAMEARLTRLEREQEQIRAELNTVVARIDKLKEDVTELKGYKIDMALIPAGKFWMGCNENVDNKCNRDEKPSDKVYLDAFYIDKYEVTVAGYKKCVGSGKCSRPGPGKDCNWNESGREDHPINCVNWYQARTYCSLLKKRLPTEAEWEKAARGTKGSIYPWGNQWDSSRANANTGGTVAVGSYPSGVSPYGAYDMAGSVWEWSSSLHNSYPYKAEDGREDPKAKGRRVLRGGCWSDPPRFVRTSIRGGNDPNVKIVYVGFRCARTP